MNSKLEGGNGKKEPANNWLQATDEPRLNGNAGHGFTEDPMQGTAKAIPRSWKSHCVVLHPKRLPDFHAYLGLIAKVAPGIDLSDRSWSAIGGNRASVYGQFRDGEWVWHVLVELGRMPPKVANIVEGCSSAEVRAAIESHESHAVIFLTSTPSETDLVDPIRRLATVAWPWLEIGAQAIAWPDAGTAWRAQDLIDVDPKTIGPDELYLFVGHEIVGSDGSGRVWFRTRGLHQFNLPDLACFLPDSHSEAEIEAVDTLFYSVAPYLLEVGGPLPSGNTIELESCLWRVVPEDTPGSLPFSSPYGFQVHELLEGP